MDWPKLTRPRKRPEVVYIRFGRWSNRSKNHATGQYERGVSVCAAILHSDDTVSLKVSECDLIWFQQLKNQGRVAFVVTGKLVGQGSDGEPVLQAVKCLWYAIRQDSLPAIMRPRLKCAIIGQVL